MYKYVLTTHGIRAFVISLVKILKNPEKQDYVFWVRDLENKCRSDIVTIYEIDASLCRYGFSDIIRVDPNWFIKVARNETNN